jgi:hypothetical protein
VEGRLLSCARSRLRNLRVLVVIEGAVGLLRCARNDRLRRWTSESKTLSSGLTMLIRLAIACYNQGCTSIPKL